MIITLVTLHLEKTPWKIPFAAGRLKAAIEAYGFLDVETRLVSAACNTPHNEIVSEIENHKPDIVGFSLYLWNRKIAEDISRDLKLKHPGVIIIAGGPDAEANYRRLIDDAAFDLVVPGEGEELLPGIIEKLKRGDTLSAIRESMMPAPVEDLGLLPSPYLTGQFDLVEHRAVLWELSRGCPFRCTFCYESRGRPGVRFFPLETIREELLLFGKSGTDQVFVLDPTFNFDKKRAKEILKLIALHTPDIHFSIEIRAEMLDDEMAELFSRITCSLQIGIQSVIPSVLRNVNRTLNKRIFAEKVALLNDRSVVYGFDLIYGLPGDSFDGFMKSFNYALSLAPNHLDIFPLTILPGTRLHEEAADFHMDFEKDNPYTIFSSPTFPAEDLKKAGDFTDAFNLFYNKGKAVSWLNILLEFLDIPPSEFFSHVVRRSDPISAIRDPSREDLTEWQITMVRAIMKDSGKEAVFPVIEDIINYFSADNWFREEKQGRRILTFNHDLEDLLANLEKGITDLEDLNFVLRKGPCTCELFWENGETRFGPARV
jgi:hypothetical protein